MLRPLIVVSLLVAACSGDSDPAITTPDAARVSDGAVVVVVDARLPDAPEPPDAALPDAPEPPDATLPDAPAPDAAPSFDAHVPGPPVIDSVTLMGLGSSDRQVRQGFGTVTLIVGGEDLDLMTSAMVGPMTANIVSSARNEARLTVMIAHGAQVADHDLTVTTSRGSDTFTRALSVTRINVATSGADSPSRGHTAAPFASVPYAMTVSAAGDVVLVGAGTFSTDSEITVPQGVRIMGAGRTSTTLTVPASFGGDNVMRTGAGVQVEDLTIACGVAVRGLRTAGDGLMVFDINVRGCSDGLRVLHDADFDGVMAVDNENSGMYATEGEIHVTGSTFSRNGFGDGFDFVGVYISAEGPGAGADLTIENSTIADNTDNGFIYAADTGATLVVRSSTISGHSHTGVRIDAGNIVETVIDFGTSGDPGGNTFSDNTLHIRDLRENPPAPPGIIASFEGSTFDGMTLDGLITGPAMDLPYYEIISNNRLQF